MIKAKPSKWAKKVFHFYVMRLMKRHFHAFQLLGEIPKIDSARPLILLPNHSTWWDGFFVYLLNEKIIKRPLYLMMLESQLSRYKFFARVGAYSIEPKRPKSTLKSLQYTVELLEKNLTPRPMICIFPQGELNPWGIRPLNFKQGIEWIIKKYGNSVNLLPLAIRTEFLEEQLPDTFFLFGKNYQINPQNFPGVNCLEEIEETLLKELGDRITHRETGQILLSGSTSINISVDRLWRRKSLT